MVMFTCKCMNITLHLARAPTTVTVNEPIGWSDAEKGLVTVGLGELGVGGASIVRVVGRSVGVAGVRACGCLVGRFAWTNETASRFTGPGPRQADFRGLIFLHGCVCVCVGAKNSRQWQSRWELDVVAL